MILNKLNKTPHRIYARKCIIKDISHLDYVNFLEQNHLHGRGINVTLRKGLYHSNKLVSVIGITQEGEIARFASLINHNIIGGFGKLFKSLKDKIKFTYADQDWTPDSTKSVYYKHFSNISSTEPQLSYYNYNKELLESRQKYQNHKLKDLFNYGFEESNETKENFLASKNILTLYRTVNYKFTNQLC